MSIVEETLAKHDGNKTRAAVDLAMGLMRGDQSNVHLGYSIGSALMAVIDYYNLSPREVALVTEGVVGATTRHYSASRRPLVIVGVGGGLIQWTVTKHGLGTPRLHELDYDREGQGGDELEEFIAEIKEAMDDLAEYHDPHDLETIDNMKESIADYQRLIRDGESAGRGRW